MFPQNEKERKSIAVKKLLSACVDEIEQSLTAIREEKLISSFEQLELTALISDKRPVSLTRGFPDVNSSSLFLCVSSLVIHLHLFFFFLFPHVVIHCFSTPTPTSNCRWCLQPFARVEDIFCSHKELLKGRHGHGAQEHMLRFQRCCKTKSLL